MEHKISAMGPDPNGRISWRCECGSNGWTYDKEPVACPSAIETAVAAVYEVAVVELLQELAHPPPSAVPMWIVDRVFQAPFALETHIDGEALAALTQRMKTSTGGQRVEIDFPEGAAVANRVTPEQLLAIVATIIATAPDAATACARIRTEVSGWAFQGADGVVR